MLDVLEIPTSQSTFNGSLHNTVCGIPIQLQKLGSSRYGRTSLNHGDSYLFEKNGESRMLIGPGTARLKHHTLAHWQRGTDAWIFVSNCIVSRCRQVRLGAMSAFEQGARHWGHESDWPQYSMSTSTIIFSGEKTTEVTFQSRSKPSKHDSELLLSRSCPKITLTARIPHVPLNSRKSHQLPRRRE